MLRKRLIFTLLYNDGNFMLSRNFRLQKVGNLNWLNKNYSFRDIATSIDELIILDVTRGNRDNDKFVGVLRELVKEVFVPISVGGGIDSLEKALYLFKNGADKIVLNSILFSNPKLVQKLVDIYGSQSIVASIDYKQNEEILYPYINNGEKKLDIELNEYIKMVQALNVGEIYLNSMDKDGTGQGYPLNLLETIIEEIQVPIILAGGAGNVNHFIEGISLSKVDAVATANIFNFIGNGLPKAREKMIKENINIADWSLY